MGSERITAIERDPARLDEAFGSEAHLNQVGRDGNWYTEILVPISSSAVSG